MPEKSGIPIFISEDVAIKSVSVIVKKDENSDFDYVCKDRFDDGFIFILSGEGEFTYSDGAKYPLAGGDLLLVNKHDNYEIKALAKGMSYVTTAFNTVPEGCLKKCGLPVYFRLGEDSSVFLKGEESYALFEEKGLFSRLESKIAMEETLLYLLRFYYGASDSESDYKRLMPAVGFLKKNYDKPTELSALADMCSMSVSLFRKVFKRSTGVSPLAFRDGLRIETAKSLLRSGLFSVTEIADKLGYCDVYHFSKSFKKHAGVSPTKFI